jgi:opacity protein-like surface antigen
MTRDLLKQFGKIYPINFQKNKLSIMKLKILIVSLCILFSKNIFSQWETCAGVGISLPITGYGEVLKTGWLINADGRYRFKKGNFAIGMKAQYVRLQKDKNPTDAFQNARMTIAPLIFTAEYSAVKGKFQPYLTGGLGITFFNLNYDTSPTTGESVNNVSFTMMPLVGIRYAASENIYPFIESGLVLIADGPPIGFPKGEKLTGYNGIVTGVCYRFK